MTSKRSEKSKTVLITGASKGIGQATARRLAERGYRVFGTTRHPGSAPELSGVDFLAMDVRDPDSVGRAVDAVLSESGGIDALVNNAGYALLGAAEEASASEIEDQFQTNYHGVVRVTNAVLPHMRAQRAGRIVNISSLVGFAAIPFMAHYSASKYALEGYSEALFQELLPLGVRVSLVRPGVVRTGLFGASVTRSARRIADYEAWHHEADASMLARVDGKSISPEQVAAVVARVLASGNPALRYQVGPDAQLVSRLKRFAPGGLFQKVWRKEMGLSGKQAAAVQK